MGAWGNGPFENDDALDLVGELEDTERPLADVLRENLEPSSARRPGFLARLLRRDSDDEGDEGNDFTVAAAAAVVAAALGLDVGSDQVGELLAKKPLIVSDKLRSTARTALARATGPDSEWYELWEESGELERTQAEIDRVRAVLWPAPRRHPSTRRKRYQWPRRRRRPVEQPGGCSSGFSLWSWSLQPACS